MTGGIAVVLGPTGRNFAAGMSGGIAYVLDGDGAFEDRCNLAMVELQPITPEDAALEALDHQGGDLETHGLVDVSHDMTRFDAQRLKGLIERHLHYTNSDVARRILDDWEAYLPRFVKVMPVDYRRALAEMQANQSRPPQPDQAAPDQGHAGDQPWVSRPDSWNTTAATGATSRRRPRGRTTTSSSFP